MYDFYTIDTVKIKSTSSSYNLLTLKIGVKNIIHIAKIKMGKILWLKVKIMYCQNIIIKVGVIIDLWV